MSEPFNPEPSEPVAKPSFRQRYVHLPRRRGARWLALGAAVVVIGGGAAAVAGHHLAEHNRHGFAVADERPDGRGGQGGKFGEHGGRKHELFKGEGHGKGKDQARGLGPEQGRRAAGAKLAPAPVPALPAAKAVEKAVGAVPGGQVDALEVVAQQGGGSAWQLDVLGTDGVRHLVTVDGVNGTITSNTVAN